MIPDERTNKLIVVATPSAMERIHDLLAQIDVPISGEGRINVYNLSNANAEELASTLQGLAQGSSGSSSAARPRIPVPARAGAPQASTGAQTAELFSGDVKITADKATNSLVITASQGDYKNLVRVIEKLDVPRQQVFVEAVIMEVTLQRNTDFGISLHQGYSLNTPEGESGGILGTNYNGSGLPPSFSLLNLASYGGFLAGLQGPPVTNAALTKLGINIPSFGIVLHALQENSDVNVLSTPHLLTSDNEEAEITVGQTVPFQAGFSPGSLGSSLGAAGAAGAGGLGGLGGIGGLSGLGGLSSLYAPINRQPVELKLTIKPQINDSDYVRMVINESTEEIASQNPVLGPTTSKRSAKTTVIAKDQETVVIGGIMQDRTINSVSKVPILGDLPILGHLFRQTSTKKVKTNLLLFLTPYIIRDESDFRRIFERKMAERQKFVEQFYGGISQYDVPVDYARKSGPFAKINGAVLREEQKAENGGPGAPGQR
jgi:general secretion pathway protein D